MLLKRKLKLKKIFHNLNHTARPSPANSAVFTTPNKRRIGVPKTQRQTETDKLTEYTEDIVYIFSGGTAPT